MNTAELLLDCFGRVQGRVHSVLAELAPEQLTARVDGANSIAWLIWHLTRIQDDHIVLTEALELSALDFEEFLASYESMTLALASHLRELGSYREAR